VPEAHQGSASGDASPPVCLGRDAMRAMMDELEVHARLWMSHARQNWTRSFPVLMLTLTPISGSILAAREPFPFGAAL